MKFFRDLFHLPMEENIVREGKRKGGREEVHVHGSESHLGQLFFFFQKEEVSRSQVVLLCCLVLY